MNIPKYVIDIMERSRYFYEFDSIKEKKDLCAVGYTILVPKVSVYSKAYTLSEEVNKLKKWVERQEGGVCHILSLPEQTRYDVQYAVVSIFDPVMKHLSAYICDKA